MNKINLSIKKEDTKHPPIIKHENERVRKNIKEIAPIIIEIKREKSKNFQEAIKKRVNNEKYEFKHPLERHF